MIEDKLLNKSKECFVMAIEIYNKPTIHYRVEGFSFFICNAWELMLKAYLIKVFGEDSIYYKDKSRKNNFFRKLYYQKSSQTTKTPLRRNLEKVIELKKYKHTLYNRRI